MRTADIRTRGQDFPRHLPLTAENPAGHAKPPPTQITERVTQGDQQHPATFFFFHLIICTVYTIATQTEILTFYSRFYCHVMYLFSSKAQQRLYAFLPLNLCYLPPSLQVYLLMYKYINILFCFIHFLLLFMCYMYMCL